MASDPPTLRSAILLGQRASFPLSAPILLGQLHRAGLALTVD